MLTACLVPEDTTLPVMAGEIAEGQRFGRLIVVELALRERSDGRRRTRVLVRCDCGNSKEVWGYNLLSGNTQSCGCLHKEGVSRRMTTHGGSRDDRRLFRLWKSMRDRCYNPRANNWAWYGGKGIQIDPAWNDFAPFREWALANGYQDGLQIDREDTGKNYEPSNCRWLTQPENIKRARAGMDSELSQGLVLYSAAHGLSVEEAIVLAVRQMVSPSEEEAGLMEEVTK